MTTESRVSDSREAFEAWALDVGHKVERTKTETGYESVDTHNAWNAWQSALAFQGPVVPVDALQGLCDEWENMKVPLSANSYELGEFDGYRGARRELTALIAKANGHE